MNVKGDLNTTFNYGITVNGANINDFKTPTNISELNITNPEDYNKDINFYIGAQLNSSLAIIYVEISIMGWTHTFGPVFSLNFLGYGGRYFTANFAKDQYDTPDQSMDKIHICAHNGEDGCLHLSEPGCEVRRLLEKGKINADRYESYVRMLASMEERLPVWGRQSSRDFEKSDVIKGKRRARSEEECSDEQQ